MEKTIFQIRDFRPISIPKIRDKNWLSFPQCLVTYKTILDKDDNNNGKGINLTENLL